MYPYPVQIAGLRLAVWHLAFLVGVAVGYPVWRAGVRAVTARDAPGAAAPELPTYLAVRWVLVVYVSVIGAQILAYLVDRNTRVLPPASVSALRYYLDPFYGPKTLYGAMLALPLAGWLALRLPRRTGATALGYSSMLDSLTPATCAVIGLCRVGCFLQGCCYGVISRDFGVVFPAAGPTYARQLQLGVITRGAAPLPMVPTQLMEAIVLLALGAWTLARLRRGAREIFAPTVVAYSLARFVLEWLRDDPERNAFGLLSASQWIALAIVLGWVARRVMIAVSEGNQPRAAADV